MASTFTANKLYELQATGDNSGTWGTTLNSNPFTVIDLNLGGVLSLSLSSSNVTLTSTQARNAIVLLGGAISANLTITFPAVGSTYAVKNGTSGSYTVTLACAGGGTSVALEQGYAAQIYTDATNAGFVNTRILGRQVGEIVDYGGSSAPTGWLLCYGQAISRTTYASLYAIISTTFGAGDGSTTFNVPDLRGRVAAGKDNMGGVAAGRLTNAASGGVLGTTLGNTGGLETNTLTLANMYPHAHTFSITTYSATPGPFGTVIANGYSPTPIGVYAGTTDSSGSGTAHNNVQPTIILNKIIYAAV